jgi:hypothetical protein
MQQLLFLLEMEKKSLGRRIPAPQMAGSRWIHNRLREKQKKSSLHPQRGIQQREEGVEETRLRDSW